VGLLTTLFRGNTSLARRVPPQGPKDTWEAVTMRMKRELFFD